MSILIRTDLSSKIGMGHATRCRALAQALAVRGMQVQFVTRTPALEAFVAPFTCIGHMEKGGGILVYDTKTDMPSYPWRRMLHNNGYKLVCLDHPSRDDEYWNLLVYPNAHQSPAILARLEADFPGRVLHGWDYVMLDSEVMRQVPVPYQERAQGPMVFCAGGSDPDGILRQMYHWSASLDIEAPKVFLVGKYATDVPVASDGHGARGGLWIEPFNRRWLRSATLVVSLFGQSVYESLYWQTPVVTFARTEEDATAIQRLGSAGINTVPSEYPPLWSAVTAERFCAMVEAHIDGDVRQGMHTASAGLMDGRGVERVAEAILELA